MDLVADNNDLAAGWVHGRVFDTLNLHGAETGGVDNQAGRPARVAHLLCLPDVGHDSALYLDAVLEKLPYKPGKVDGCVDANAPKLAG